jgi:SAM-dependent methyltransferase
MTDKQPFDEVLASWQLPARGDLLDCVEQMVRPTLLAGYFGSSYTRFVSGLQYHLGRAQDTRELAELCKLCSSDRVLDICCFIGGPAVQLAESYRCRVTGIDLDQKAILTANRIAALTGHSDLLKFKIGDASTLPFDKEHFDVVWNQCSLQHDRQWIEEADRVLVPGGRLALTFQLRGKASTSSEDPHGRWDLDDLSAILREMGYVIIHAEEITERDIEIGWKALDRKLSDRAQEFTDLLGADWVKGAHQEFSAEIAKMRAGRWGNGRIVGLKGR